MSEPNFWDAQRELRRSVFKLNLSDAAKLVALALLDFVHFKTGDTHVSGSSLAKVTGMDLRTCQRAVADMQRIGFIRPTGERAGYHNCSPVYAIVSLSNYVTSDVAQPKRATSRQTLSYVTPDAELRQNKQSSYVTADTRTRNFTEQGFEQGLEHTYARARGDDSNQARTRTHSPSARGGSFQKRPTARTNNGNSTVPFIPKWWEDEQLTREMAAAIGVPEPKGTESWADWRHEIFAEIRRLTQGERER